MIKKTAVLFTALAVMSGISAPVAKALSFSINIGDQPYYSHGPGYWSQGVYYAWVPGYDNKNNVWVHGHYRVK